MATYSSGYAVKLITTGDESGTWGTSTNENLSRIDNALGGCVVINVESPATGSTWNAGTNTLTWLQRDTDNAGTTGTSPGGGGRARMVVFADSGTMDGDITVQVRGNSSSAYPERVFFVKNALSDSRSINIDLNGTDYVLRNGRFAALFTSATNKGPSNQIAANTVNNLLDYLQISNLDFGDDSTAQIIVKDSQANALKVTDGTTTFLTFDSNANKTNFAAIEIEGSNFDINGGTIDNVTTGDSSSLGSNNVLMGASAGAAFSANTDEVVSVGSSAMASGGGGTAANSNCVAIGFEAGKTATSSPQNVFIGSNAGETSDYTQHSVYVGFSAGKYHKGASSGYALRNIGIGAWTMTGADDSSDAGDDCVAVGSYSLKDFTNNSECVAIGSYALGKSSSGNENVAIGFKAIYDGTSVPTGANNIAIGSEALKAAVGAEQNVCIGSNSGYALVSGDGNVMIGYESGKAETGSNKLYIQNSDSAAPLIYGEFDNHKVQINSAHTSNNTLTVNNSHSAYTGDLLHLTTTDARDAGFDFIKADANTANQFRVNGLGTVYAQNTTVQAADYADMFEWADGNPDDEDRIGLSVVLDGDGCCRSALGNDPIEDIVGVVSGTACMIGNAAWNEWEGKSVKDEFGRVKDGEVSPDYDESMEYVSRLDRKEWATVGLVGRIHIRKDSLKNPSWRKIRNVSDTTEEWLVR
tara:strand:- start:6593 stop:8683 length:2091 start_codon:yes stop_codon:yes gene_type:complete